MDVQHDSDRRPHSSDAKTEGHSASADGHFHLFHEPVPRDVQIKPEPGTRSPRASVDYDHDHAPRDSVGDVMMGGTDLSHAAEAPARRMETDDRKQTPPPPIKEASRLEGSEADTAKQKGIYARSKAVQFSSQKDFAPPVQSWDSDDEEEEDMEGYFDKELDANREKLQKLDEDAAMSTLIRRIENPLVVAFVRLGEEALSRDPLAPVPEDVILPSKALVPPAQEVSKESAKLGDAVVSVDVPMPAKIPEAMMNASTIRGSTSHVEPKMEMDVDEVDSKSQAPTKVADKEDVAMEDAESNVAAGPAALVGEIDEENASARPTEAGERGSQQPSTPSQVEDEGDETESDFDAMTIDAVRKAMTTPPIDSLPVFNVKAWDRDSNFLQSLESDPAVDAFVLGQLDHMSLDMAEEQLQEQGEYRQAYTKYLQFTSSNDPAAVKSREKFAGAIAPVENIIPAAATPELVKPEGRGVGRRYASERDLERVLQASMKEDEERRQREEQLQKEKYRSEKEAEIPDMYWNEQELTKDQYYDYAGHVATDQLSSVWECLPPIPNFTDDETQTFEKKYLEGAKQWGKVAEDLPQRNFKACIQFYYLKKKELNLKEKLKRQPKKKKPRTKGKQRSSALVSELGNGDPETEETTETGENGERRRPRRAAAPTFNCEQPTNADSDNGTNAGTPGRRNAGATKDGTGEKVDGRKGRRKAKDKEPKAAKQQALAAAPAPRGRSRSNSRPQNAENQAPPTGAAEPPRLPVTYEQPSGIQPPQLAPAQPPAAERPSVEQPSPMSSLMAPPSNVPPQLRPEPMQQQTQSMLSSTLSFVSQQPSQPQERRTAQASSYWSVSEITEFPGLLRAFGTEWAAISAHMGTKTPIMVSMLLV